MATEKATKHAARFKDLTGRTFGRLTVIKIGERAGRSYMWECVCTCGNSHSASGWSLRCGDTASCGCLQRERVTKHGQCRSSEYRSWVSAKNRCHNPNSQDYERYGARGIKMCEEWRDDFPAFIQHIGKRPKGGSLDRIDNEKGYEPGNVRWTTAQKQARNRQRSIAVTHNGETLSLNDWAIRTGISADTLRARFHGYSKVPLFAPVKRRVL